MQDPNGKQQAASFALRPSHHRRAHSEVNFRLPEDLDLVSDPFDAPVGSSFEELGSEDDLFSTYMDIEKLGGSNSNSNVNEGVSSDNAGGGAAGGGSGGIGRGSDGEKSLTATTPMGGRPRHRYSNSMDSSGLLLGESSIEAKKAMAPDKLAELWTIDPKRAKRYISFYF